MALGADALAGDEKEEEVANGSCDDGGHHLRVVLFSEGEDRLR